MLQEGGVYPGVKAEEMLRHVASLHAHPLDVAGPGRAAGPRRRPAARPYRRLSGGQQQRLSLAMAVVGRPELVFLDEPTAGLDPQARRATWELVEALRRDGVTVVLTTHFMDEAERLADQVVVVDHGRVVAVGSPGELTAAGAERQPALRRAARAGPRRAAPRRCRPRAGCEEVAPGRVRRARRRRRRTCSPTSPPGAPTAASCPRACTVGRRSLEDVFLELTGSEPAAHERRRRVRARARRRAAAAGCWPRRPALEVRMVLRNGEQLLLTVVIPVLVLVVFGSVEVMDLGSRAARVDFLVPGVLALAVMSTAFTGLAIGTGFERRYGVLKRLGASPLPRGALLGAKGLAVLVIEALQVLLLATVALALGWSPHGLVGRGPAAACSPAPPRSARSPC